ncbi:hypothetical protein LINGRAHAP2_LOCUS20424, partial [Linum grandiflorum]
MSDNSWYTLAEGLLVGQLGVLPCDVLRSIASMLLFRTGHTIELERAYLSRSLLCPLVYISLVA